MGEEKCGLIHTVVDRIKNKTSAIKTRLCDKWQSGNARRPAALGLLIGINSIILLLIPVLVYFNGHAQAVEEKQIAETLQRSGSNSPPNLIIDANTSASNFENNDEAAARIGIDVSRHQGVIDWNSVAANGIDFAIVRAGARGYLEGNIVADEYFNDNIQGAKAAGLYIGVYFFSQAINEQEALAEADFVLGALAGRPLDYPIIYDLENVTNPEGRVNQLDSLQKSANARAFCERIQEAGYQAMIYGNAKDLSYYDYTLIIEFDIWFAQYDTDTPNLATYPIKMWQFSSSGVIAGIDGRVDLNMHFRDDDIRQLPQSVSTHSG